MRKSSFAFLFGAVLFLSGGPGVAGQEKSVREKVTDHWLKYKQELKGYQIKIIRSSENLQSGENKINHMTEEYKQLGEWKLMLFDSNEKGGSGRCRSLNGRYEFELSKETNKAWRLEDLNVDVSGGPKIWYIREFMDDEFTRGCSPYNLDNLGFFPELLKRPGVTLTNTEPQGGLVKVTFQAVPDEVSAKQTGRVHLEGKGWILLDPNSYWRIMEFEAPFKEGENGFMSVSKYEYVLGTEKLPLLKRTESTYVDSTGKQFSRSVKKFIFQKRVPSEFEFTLSAFDLPEPPGMPAVDRPGSRWYLWLALAAVAILSAGGVVVMIKRRYCHADVVAVAASVTKEGGS